MMSDKMKSVRQKSLGSAWGMCSGIQGSAAPALRVLQDLWVFSHLKLEGGAWYTLSSQVLGLKCGGLTRTKIVPNSKQKWSLSKILTDALHELNTKHVYSDQQTNPDDRT